MLPQLVMGEIFIVRIHTYFKSLFVPIKFILLYLIYRQKGNWSWIQNCQKIIMAPPSPGLSLSGDSHCSWSSYHLSWLVGE